MNDARLAKGKKSVGEFSSRTEGLQPPTQFFTQVS